MTHSQRHDTFTFTTIMTHSQRHDTFTTVTTHSQRHDTFTTAITNSQSQPSSHIQPSRDTLTTVTFTTVHELPKTGQIAALRQNAEKWPKTCREVAKDLPRSGQRLAKKWPKTVLY